MTSPALSDAFDGGFANFPFDSARAFRAILQALSRPGQIVTLTGAIPPAPLSPAAGIAALTLLDATTPVHLAGPHDTEALRQWLTFHTGAPLVGPAEAAFAIGTWDWLCPVARFAIGTSEYPDRAATLIVEMAELTMQGARLTGPGIQGTARLSLPEIAAFVANGALFPLGFDALLTCGHQLAGLPRSTRVGAG